MNNDSKGDNDVINGVPVKRLKVRCKKKMEGVQQFFLFKLGYINYFNWRLIVITKINLFKGYMDTT